MSQHIVKVATECEVEHYEQHGIVLGRPPRGQWYSTECAIDREETRLFHAVFNVNKAYDAIARAGVIPEALVPAVDAPKLLRCWVGPDGPYHGPQRRPSDTWHEFGNEVDWQYAERVNAAEAGIMARMPSGLSYLIDGSHRLAKAWRLGWRTWGVYDLPEAALRDVMFPYPWASNGTH